MTVYLLMGGALFTASVVVGFAMDRWAAWKPRHDLRRAFAHGRADNVVRLSLPVEPLPVLCRREAV